MGDTEGVNVNSGSLEKLSIELNSLSLEFNLTRDFISKIIKDMRTLKNLEYKNSKVLALSLIYYHSTNSKTDPNENQELYKELVKSILTDEKFKSAAIGTFTETKIRANILIYLLSLQAHYSSTTS